MGASSVFTAHRMAAEYLRRYERVMEHHQPRVGRFRALRRARNDDSASRHGGSNLAATDPELHR